MSTYSSINYQRDFWYKWLVRNVIDLLMFEFCLKINLIFNYCFNIWKQKVVLNLMQH